MNLFRTLVAALLFAAGLSPVCASSAAAEAGAPVTLLIAAAASLERAFESDLIPLFRARRPGIAVEGTYDSSGKLQTQIENGLEADVFMSAATAQMDALASKGFIAPESVAGILENKIVLIRPAPAEPSAASSASPATSFADAANADMIAVGDPASVPAGQYAREIFTSLGIWDEIASKASFGTNVTEVLNWVAAGSAGLGVVYATDAALTDKVSVVCEAPAGSLKSRVLYPAGLLKNSRHPEEAGLFLAFLSSEEARAVFKKYGFSPAE